MKMSEYQILPSQVLIVPGYTNEEIIAMSAKTNDSSASALKNATSSTDKTAKDEDATKKNTSNTSSANSTKSSASSKTQNQTKSRLRKGRQAKIVDEYKAKAKKAYTKIFSDNHGLYKPNAYYTHSSANSNNNDNHGKYKPNAYYAYKNKNKASTKTTSKTKTTKKTSKASKKKKTTSKTTKSKAGSSQKSSKKSSSKSKVNESSAAVATESQIKVEKPKALLFSPETVEYTPHRKDYEEFNSADGLILIEKACDQFAELELSLSVHQAMRIQENGTIELSADDKRPIDIITEGAPTILDTETELGHFMDPADFTDSYIEIRRGFFDRYMGRPLTLVSDLFPTIAVCYITDISYNINEGEEQAEYSITFREVDNTWG